MCIEMVRGLRIGLGFGMLKSLVTGVWSLLRGCSLQVRNLLHAEKFVLWNPGCSAIRRPRFGVPPLLCRSVAYMSPALVQRVVGGLQCAHLEER